MYQVITEELTAWSKNYDGPQFHACLCDPPYDLAFMGKTWDRNADFKAWGEAIYPHLFPGAIVLMFGGTRTWHRLATGMEDAGFQMWDTLMWLYGTGFPKGQDISKLIDKQHGKERDVIGQQTKARCEDSGSALPTVGSTTVYKTWEVTAPSDISAPWAGHKTPALKPAWEPILAFRKPAKETYADLALNYGSGTLSIDASRIGTEVVGWGGTAAGGSTWNQSNSGLCKQGEARPVNGRYPANLIFEYPLLKEEHQRFFYVAKPSRKERDAGLESFEERPRPTMGSGIGGQPDQERANNRNIHPTVKPVKLTEYLAKLLLPPDAVKPRRIIVPFAGSGSEMIGCLKAGWDEIIGIEMSADYSAIAESRLRFHDLRAFDPNGFQKEVIADSTHSEAAFCRL